MSSTSSHPNSSKPDGVGGRDTQQLAEALVIIAFSVAMFALTFTFERVPEIFAQGIQPTVFPRAVLIIMFTLACLQAYKAMHLSATQAIDLKPYVRIPKIVVWTGVLLIVFVVAMRWIGTFPTVIMFCPALALLWGERRWKLMLFGFGVFVAFAYLLFRLIMNVPLP